MIREIKKLLKNEPDLKARTIARSLGLDRAEVSRLLHARKDLFVQNDNFEWRLAISSEEVEVIFEPKWVRCHSFENSLTDTQLDTAKRVTFIFPEKCRFLLETISRFLALCNQLVRDKKKVTIDLSANTDSLTYLSRAGFFNHLNEKVTILPDRPSNDAYKKHIGKNKNLVEFGAVDPQDQNKELVKQLTASFVARTSKKYDDAAFTIFSELIGNIREHSATKQEGFAALQIYNPPNMPSHIQSVISDSGIGIADSLRPALKAFYPKFQKLSDIDLVKRVMSEGQISKHGSESGHGMGFKSSKEKALKFNAKYSVRQSDFSLEFQFVNGKLQPIKELTGLVTIHGTHICFDFDIDGDESA